MLLFVGVASFLQYIDNNTKKNKRTLGNMNGLDGCPDYIITGNIKGYPHSRIYPRWMLETINKTIII